MSFSIYALTVAAVLFIQNAAVALATPPNATTLNGTYVGTYSEEYDQDFFLGVPFAQPPLGELRFAVPQSLNTSFDGTRDATSYSSACIGYGSPEWNYDLSEDCLYLNVVRPANYSSYEEPLPVAVWIYGGSFFQGAASDLRYNLSFIVQNSVQINKPFIGISINYRLGAWGFLASSEVAEEGSTNLGLRDQRLALHWIQENIGAFGGDPTEVIIWGESAGAMSVGYHLIAYNGRDDKLFRGGILESGNSVQYNSLYTQDHFDAQYQALVDTANCTTAPNALACMRSLPFETMSAAINTTNATAWYVTIDGDFVADFPSVQLSAGNYVHVPIIDGCNTDEGSLLAPMGINTTDQFLAYVEAGSTYYTPLSPDVAEQIVNAYPDDPCQGIPADLGCTRLNNSYGLEFRRVAAYQGDVMLIAPRRLQCQTWATAGLPAYCYRFNTRPSGFSLEAGVAHFQEVAFVFDNTNGYGYEISGYPDPFEGMPESYFSLAALMSSSWASFIHDLDPNSFRANDTVAPQWPVYDNADPKNFVLDANVTELAYLEPDTFRADSISTILSLNSVLRR